MAYGLADVARKHALFVIIIIIIPNNYDKLKIVGNNDNSRYLSIVSISSLDLHLRDKTRPDNELRTHNLIRIHFYLSQTYANWSRNSVQAIHRGTVTEWTFSLIISPPVRFNQNFIQ